MVSEVSLLLQSSLATSLCNLASRQRDEFSTSQRTEGWTEIWGDSSGASKDESYWKVEEEDAARISSPSTAQIFPDIPITLIQYRPAWLEQLVLRIAKIPHVVVNSSYFCSEATGPLPVLRDVPISIDKNNDRPPILVGRCHPGFAVRDDKESLKTTTGFPSNSILEYLQVERKVDLDAHLPATDHLLSKLFTQLIITKLHTCLKVLRYEDQDAWLQVYRNQCLDATRVTRSNASPETKHNTPTGTAGSQRSLFPTMRGLYQAWSERVMARKGLLIGGEKPMSVEEATLEARKCYEMLEEQFGKRPQGVFYLLGTTQPAWVDALLWNHLAEALCDLHLVTLLADFPLLVKYFQHIYETYFGASTKTSTGALAKLDWKIWNVCENQINPFQQIAMVKDLNARKTAKEEFKKFTHALELMQSLSVHDHDLLEVLKVAREARVQDDLLVRRRRAATSKSSDACTKQGSVSEPSAIEKARRQQQRNDQHWISMVAGVMILAAFSSYARASSSSSGSSSE